MSDLVLRPRSATELIDAAFQVYRRAPVPFMVAMALVYVPWLALRLIFSLNVPETPEGLTPGFTRVIFISGGVFTPTTQAFLAALSNTKLTKPFEPQDLHAAVARAMALVRS